MCRSSNRENPKLKNLTIPQALAVHRNSTVVHGLPSQDRSLGHRVRGIRRRRQLAARRQGRDPAQEANRSSRSTRRAELPTGVKVDGMRELREELLRSKSDEFRRAMLRKVMAYALGRSLTLGDIEAADALVPALRARDDRLPALIELIVASEPFQSK